MNKQMEHFRDLVLDRFGTIDIWVRVVRLL